MGSAAFCSQYNRPGGDAMKMPKLTYAAVLWHDAHGALSKDETFTVDDLPRLHGTMEVLTCGWIVQEDEKGVTLASEWYVGQAEFRGRTFIPASGIAEIHRFRGMKRATSSKARSKTRRGVESSLEPDAAIAETLSQVAHAKEALETYRKAFADARAEEQAKLVPHSLPILVNQAPTKSD